MHEDIKAFDQNKYKSLKNYESFYSQYRDDNKHHCKQIQVLTSIKKEKHPFFQI